MRFCCRDGNFLVSQTHETRPFFEGVVKQETSVKQELWISTANPELARVCVCFTSCETKKKQEKPVSLFHVSAGIYTRRMKQDPETNICVVLFYVIYGVESPSHYSFGEIMRECKCCNTTKDYSEFSILVRRGKPWTNTVCKECVRAKRRVYDKVYLSDPAKREKARERTRKWRETPSGKEKVAEYRRDPESKLKKLEYQKKYTQRPDVKQKSAEYQKRYLAKLRELAELGKQVLEQQKSV